jgi:allophanate hydrolase subunit 1
VPFGSVAVAMSMSVIYPQESPGGWHILARTPVPLWQMRKSPPALLAAGDQVTFEPLSLREYERMLTKAAASELCVTPEGPPTQGHRA